MASLSPNSGLQHEFLLLGSSKNIVRRCGPALTHLLRGRFHCEASVSGLDTDHNSLTKPTITPEKRLETSLPCGVKVSVWKADLTNFTVRAVVNAANSKLQHYGGLASALSEAGGPGIQKESDDYVRKNREVKTGEAVVLRAGQLKCDYIIHAVGPQLSSNPNKHEVSASRPQLERTVRSILELVEKHQIESVAIPAISSGIFNYPLSVCADTIVATVGKFYNSSSHRFRPKDVFLVNNDEPTVKEMERACGHILSPPQSYSQATANNPPTRGGTGAEANTRGGKRAEGNTRGGKNVIDFGVVRVFLRKGRLEEQNMDVIVNTIGSDRNLSIGQVSKTLSAKAGFEMQMEMNSAPYSGFLYVTKPYKLHCKQVYHTTCMHKGQPGSDKYLFQSVTECLFLAVTNKHRSIAFPAIGTGNLGFGKRETAHLMWSAVMEFSQKTPEPLEVHFVIFTMDEPGFKAFEEELRSLRPKAAQMEFPLMSAGITGPPYNMNSKPAPLFTQEQQAWSTDATPSGPPSSPPYRPEPCIHLSGPSESLQEARAWLRGLLYNEFNKAVINNNLISLLEEKQLLHLSQCIPQSVEVEEFLEKGQYGLVVSGEHAEDIAVAAVRIEEVLSQTQETFMKEEQEELRALGRRRPRGERSPVSRSIPEIKPVVSQLKRDGLEVLKAEKFDNPVLEKLFDHYKSQISSSAFSSYSFSPSSSSSSSVMMLQLISAQFCDMVGHIGFRPECAPPDDPVLGEGIYFAADVKTALSLWTAPRGEQFIYLVLSEVLKGRSGPGRPGLVLPPVLSTDPSKRYDSVEQAGVAVVFSHLLALPRYLLICRREGDRQVSSL